MSVARPCSTWRVDTRTDQHRLARTGIQPVRVGPAEDGEGVAVFGETTFDLTLGQRRLGQGGVHDGESLTALGAVDRDR